MRVVVLQSNYLPWKGYFDLIHEADLFVFRDDVKYTKQDWRNRNKCYPKEGLRWLTVPVGRAALSHTISTVRLPDSEWQIDHYATLCRAYRRAPYFSQLEPLMREIYLDTQWKYLADLNRRFIESVSAMLGICTRFDDSAHYELAGDRVLSLLHLLMQVNATEYLTGPAARNYLSGSEHLFAENGIRLIYKDYAGYPAYSQLREPFEPGVSIVDMIANIPLRNIPYYIWGWREQVNQPQPDESPAPVRHSALWRNLRTSGAA